MLAAALLHVMGDISATELRGHGMDKSATECFGDSDNDPSEKEMMYFLSIFIGLQQSTRRAN